MRILVLSNVVPHPPHGGIQLRILRLLERISQRHEVTLCCHARSDADEANAHELTRRGISTWTGRLRPATTWREFQSAAEFGIAARPPELALYRSPALLATVRRLLQSQTYDILQIEETILTHYADVLPPTSPTKKLLIFHNIHAVQAARAAALESAPGMRLWRRFNSVCMRYYEPWIASRFDRCATVTDWDRELLKRRHPNLAVDVVPNGVDTRSLTPIQRSSGPPTIVFVGNMSYKPCEDAALWLVRDILPRLRRRFAGIQVWIVGKNPAQRVNRLASDHVFITGEVPDVTPYYALATVAVVPIRAGSGSRLKILEAMALGRPVVSTSIGAEGLDVKNGTNILLADETVSFAAAVERLLADEGLSDSLAGAARHLVERHYDWNGIAETLLRIYDEMASVKSGGNGRKKLASKT